MKKKITAVILTITICSLFSGCSDDGTDANGNPVEYGYFVELEFNGDMKIVYDRETKVKYYIYDAEDGIGDTHAHCFGITPIYNADGSLQLYEGE